MREHPPEVRSAIADAQVAQLREKIGVGSDELNVSPVTAGPFDGSQDAANIDSINKFPIYNTRTGKMQPVLLSMISAKLQLRWREGMDVPAEYVGRPVWSLDPVDVPIKRQQLKCLLHPENDERDYYNSIGLGEVICRKSNFASRLAVRQHMNGRHKQEWALIREEERFSRENEQSTQVERLVKALAPQLSQAEVEAVDNDPFGLNENAN